MSETRPGAARDAAPGAKSDLAIASVEAIKLKLPYKRPVSFASQSESAGHYVILRIVLSNGTEGVAESVCRPGHTGEDAVTVAYQLETFFKPLLIGADPLGHLALLAKIAKVRECRAAKMLIDVALWDLRGKVFDTFAGDFPFADGTITPSDAPGFGAALDRRKIEHYAF